VQGLNSPCHRSRPATCTNKITNLFFSILYSQMKPCTGKRFLFSYHLNSESKIFFNLFKPVGRPIPCEITNTLLGLPMNVLRLKMTYVLRIQKENQSNEPSLQKKKSGILGSQQKRYSFSIPAKGIFVLGWNWHVTS